MKTILVVEDDNSMRDMLQLALQDMGYHPFTASDGREALHFLHTHQPDLVLSDLMMPFCDGWELYATMQDHPRYHTVPFVAMSSGAPAQLKQQHRRLPDVIVQKPFDLEELSRTIDRLIH